MTLMVKNSWLCWAFVNACGKDPARDHHAASRHASFRQERPEDEARCVFEPMEGEQNLKSGELWS